MDYKGDYFPEEEDNIESYKMTTAKAVKLFFKFLLYFIAIAIYGVIMFRFITSCDSSILEKVYFSDEAKAVYTENPDNFEVYYIRTVNYLNSDGTIQLKKIAYSPSINEFEIGIKFKDTITDGNTDAVFKYTLADSNDNQYELVSRRSDNRFNYGYERVSFKGINLDLSLNIINNLNNSDEMSKFYDTTSKDDVDNDPNNVRYTFSVYYNDELIDSFEIYDNYTYIEELEYKVN
ncbi:MAG: hypothetical protein A2Y17_05640 [Clostridiales bacterium GWF2_38_85]|nr:MAG: hypothetical protein A2Y17_05640 [Clostridiales bacterium GWF2_38_85]HBL84036.1 hypothetical protein [Clostridiales bacterium]